MIKRALVRLLPHPVYRMIRSRRIARMISGYAPRIVEHSYGPHRLRVSLEDPLAEGWYDRDWPELSELRKLRELGVLRSGIRVFDLGAHQAVVALMLAREVGDEGWVLAVEAEPHNAAVARRNAELNGARRLTVINAAAADHPGQISFAEGLNGRVDASTKRGNVTVRAVTVDMLADEHGTPDLVFIDVEGYEGRVLAGAPRTLAGGMTTFLVEVHVGSLVDADAQGIVNAFGDRYDVVIADEGGENGATEAWRFADGELPAGRFYLIAKPRSAERAAPMSSRTSEAPGR